MNWTKLWAKPSCTTRNKIIYSSSITEPVPFFKSSLVNIYYSNSVNWTSPNRSTTRFRNQSHNFLTLNPDYCRNQVFQIHHTPFLFLQNWCYWSCLGAQNQGRCNLCNQPKSLQPLQFDLHPQRLKQNKTRTLPDDPFRSKVSWTLSLLGGVRLIAKSGAVLAAAATASRNIAALASRFFPTPNAAGNELRRG